MSTQRKTDQDELGIDEGSVVDYLTTHNDFFVENPSLLAMLEIPHTCGNAVSLVEHQVRVLRDQNRQLKRKLMDLIQVARDNDRLNERMHKLTRGLLMTGSLEDLIETLRTLLQGEFKADAVSIRLAGLTEDEARTCGAEQLSAKDRQNGSFKGFLRAGLPQCGRFKPKQLDYLFSDGAPAIESAAVIPIGKDAARGLLAIGSHEASRFHPGMGTMFLSHLGELLGDLVQQFIPEEQTARD